MFLLPEQDFNPDPFPLPMIPPTETPGGGDLVRIEVNREWLQFVTGAACALVLEKCWLVDTDEEMLEIRQRAMDLLGQLNTPVVERPFYESDDNADDEDLPASPWYETLSDWVIEAFLAITFTPQAAIVYSQTIPRIRLVFRTGNLGAIVRVLIDSIEIWSGSTNAETVGHLAVNLDVATFATEHELGAGPWTLRIEHAGAPVGLVALGETTAYKMEVELGDIRPQSEATLDLRQNVCVLQESTDGTTWTDLYDPTTCIDDLINVALTDAINTGVLCKCGDQPAPTPPPEALECTTIHVRLEGYNRWLCPFPLNGGDTVLITNAEGMLEDGIGDRYCPDGNQASDYSCVPLSGTHVTGDPIADDAYHMELIGKLGTGYIGPFFTTFEIASGVIDQPFSIQANAENLKELYGAVGFDVQICRGAQTHCHTYDFTVSDQGWEAYNGTGGTYVGGEGWRTVLTGGAYYALVEKTFSSPLVLTNVTLDVSADQDQTDHAWQLYTYYSGGFHAVTPVQTFSAGRHTYTFSIDPTAISNLWFNPNGIGSYYATVHSIEICYNGPLVL